MLWPRDLLYDFVDHHIHQHFTKIHQLHLSISLFLTAHLFDIPVCHSTAVSNFCLQTSCLLELDFFHLDHSIEPCN